MIIVFIGIYLFEYVLIVKILINSHSVFISMLFKYYFNSIYIFIGIYSLDIKQFTN